MHEACGHLLPARWQRLVAEGFLFTRVVRSLAFARGWAFSACFPVFGANKGQEKKKKQKKRSTPVRA